MGNLPSTGSGRTDAGGDARAPRMMPTNPVSEYGTCLGQVPEQFVAATSLSIPGIIAAETSLSFLGLGIQRPAIIWGICLPRRRTCSRTPRLLGLWSLASLAGCDPGPQLNGGWHPRRSRPLFDMRLKTRRKAANCRPTKHLSAFRT